MSSVEKQPEEMTTAELVQDASNLPDVKTNLLSHNERALIQLAKELGKRLYDCDAMRDFDTGCIQVLRRDNERCRAREILARSVFGEVVNRLRPEAGDTSFPDHVWTKKSLTYGEARRIIQLAELFQ